MRDSNAQAVDGMLTLRASKVVVFVRKRSLMCKGSHWRRGRNARLEIRCSIRLSYGRKYFPV